MLHRKMSPKLHKRSCDIKMRLVPCGSGWTDVYFDICGDSHYFIISNVMGNQFSDFLRILYHLHPNHGDPANADDIMEYKYGLCTKDETGYHVVKVLDQLQDEEPSSTYQDIPWKAQFTWDEERARSNWTLERIPNQSEEFMLKVHIVHERSEVKIYDYEIPYKDLCYAVAKACTDMLKEYGFYGYHYSTFTEDINIRHLLFLKSVALDNYDARKLTYYQEKGHGETTSLEKELELLLFDM